MTKKRFLRCECGNIVTEDDCGASTDDEGFTYCCSYNPYTGEFRNDDENDYEDTEYVEGYG